MFCCAKETSPRDVSFTHPKYIFDRWGDDNNQFLGLFIFMSTWTLWFELLIIRNKTCADPESFPREGPTLTTFFLRGSKYHQHWAIIGVSLVGWWWPKTECYLRSVVISRQSRPVLLRNPIFCDFQGEGVQTLCPTPLYPGMLTSSPEGFELRCIYSGVRNKVDILWKHSMHMRCTIYYYSLAVVCTKM